MGHYRPDPDKEMPFHHYWINQMGWYFLMVISGSTFQQHNSNHWKQNNKASTIPLMWNFICMKGRKLPSTCQQALKTLEKHASIFGKILVHIKVFENKILIKIKSMPLWQRKELAITISISGPWNKNVKLKEAKGKSQREWGILG